MLRTILGTVAGVVVAGAVIYGWEVVGHRLFPLPAGLDVSDPAQRVGLVNRMPLIAQVWLIAGYAIGAAVGGLAANLVVQRSWPALVVGVLVAAASVANVMMIPHPMWMQIAGVALPLLAGLGLLLQMARGERPPPEADATA